MGGLVIKTYDWRGNTTQLKDFVQNWQRFSLTRSLCQNIMLLHLIFPSLWAFHFDINLFWMLHDPDILCRISLTWRQTVIYTHTTNIKASSQSLPQFLLDKCLCWTVVEDSECEGKRQCAYPDGSGPNPTQLFSINAALPLEVVLHPASGGGAVTESSSR